MKNIKIISLIFLTALFFNGCRNINEPSVAAQVFSVLTAQPAQVARDGSVGVSSLDAASSPGGGVEVSNIYTPGLSGTDVVFTQGGSVTFTPADMKYTRPNSYVFLKPAETTTSGATTFTTQQELVLGGSRKNLHYGDYGYWMETTTASGANTGTYYHWAPFVIYDPANISTNIPANNNTNYVYTGRMLGGLDLYDASDNLVEVGEITGNISLNANFNKNTLSGSMTFFVNDKPWYTGAVTSTGGAQANGSFTGAIKIDMTTYGGRYALTGGAGGGYNAALAGQFLGKSGAIPAEAVGLFSIVANPGSSNSFGFRPEVYGAFGVKK